MAKYDRAALIDLLKREAVMFGDFTLASGRKSNTYIDCRRVTLSAAGAALVGAGLLELLADLEYDAVGGLTLGADPILSAMLTIAGTEGRPLRGFIARKQAKDHGAGKLVEGPIRAGDRVVVVDDVATSGGSCFLAIEAAEAVGAKVAAVAVVLDRLSGAADAFAARGYPFRALCTTIDLGL
ncbi:MAG: orotate phosphoribosyltransferase [Planctomycetia bacterium]